jgi:hypothetical protein
MAKFPALEEAKLVIEQLLNATLEECYSSREDDNEDEDYGHFVDFSYDLGEDTEPLIVQIYEDGKVQFFYDASPYPVSANTEEESRTMAQSLIHFPVPFDEITSNDCSKVLETIKENY